MKKLHRLQRVLIAGALSAALAFGAATVTSTPTQAMGPIIMCGPTYQWSCAKIGGPNLLFIGTLCDRARLERRTSYVCKPIVP